MNTEGHNLNPLSQLSQRLLTLTTVNTEGHNLNPLPQLSQRSLTLTTVNTEGHNLNPLSQLSERLLTLTTMNTEGHNLNRKRNAPRGTLIDQKEKKAGLKWQTPLSQLESSSASWPLWPQFACLSTGAKLKMSNGRSPSWTWNKKPIQVFVSPFFVVTHNYRSNHLHENIATIYFYAN